TSKYSRPADTPRPPPCPTAARARPSASSSCPPSRRRSEPRGAGFQPAAAEWQVGNLLHGPSRGIAMFTPIRGASALPGAFVVVAATTAATPVPVGDLHVQPASLTLTHARRPHSLLVTARSADGLSLDLTGQATYHSGNDKVVTVSVL